MSQEKEKILVTSALPYANGPLHLGHMAGAYLPADIFVRYHRLKGNDIVYICGSDEHGVPITIRADEEGVSPQEVADKYHDLNKISFEKAGISFDNFSKTTLPVHYKTSKEFFTNINDKGVFVKKDELQLFCETDNRYLADRFVEGKCPKCGNLAARGDQCEKCGTWLDPKKLIDPQCKICGNPPIERSTRHWYIPLGKFQKQLEEWIDSKEGWKDNVLNFCRGWFEQGLEDRAVTRDLDWGIPVPLEDAKGKVLYVWFDAPIGYISSTKEWAEKIGKPDKWKEYWCESDAKIYHFIGKDNIVFHAIFFPVILMANGGYNLPENVVANEFLNLESRKFSTSQNFAVWLDTFLNDFTADSLRYCLASVSPENRDSDFSWKDYQARNNNELADILGNFVNRTIVFAHKYFDGQVPEPKGLSEADTQVINEVSGLLAKVEESIVSFKVKAGISFFMDMARTANKYFNDAEPWHAIRTDKQKCANTIYTSVQIVSKLILAMYPYLPFAAEKLMKTLHLEKSFQNKFWDELKENKINSGQKIEKPEILFAKIEDKVIEKELEKLEKSISDSGEKPEKPADRGRKETEELSEITIDDFKKLDLRIAEIKSASKVPKTDKLMKLEVDDGEDVRFIISGIAENYNEDELIGKQIVILANLKPAKIRGEISNGMLLAAGNGEDFALLIPDTKIKPGCKIT